jgi:hypothetical protein
MPDPIKHGELCIVVRSTANDLCTVRDIGKPVTTAQKVGFLHLGPNPGLIPFWTVKGGAWKCPHCGTLRDGYLEADLQPIRPPAKDVGEATITELVVDVPGEVEAS